MKKVIWLLCFAVLALSLNGCGGGGGDGGGDSAYDIGDTGPAGGLIFYVDTDDVHEWTYLEVAPISTEWTLSDWGKMGTAVIGTGTAIGSGENNTALIVTVLNDTPAVTDRAAQLCDALVYNGYNDWFLPSKDELNAIWDNLVDDGMGNNSGIAGFDDYAYWSSSELDDDTAWRQSFNTGTQDTNHKTLDLNVRAIRAF
jgi:hypothetical protein